MKRAYNNPTHRLTESTSSHLRGKIDRWYPPMDYRPTNRWEPGTREGYGRRWHSIGPFGDAGKGRPQGTIRRWGGVRLKGQRKGD